MSRTKVNPTYREELCGRLKRLLRVAYDDNWAQLAKRLGYANSSGVAGIKEGTSIPDPEKLRKIAGWEIEGGLHPSLHWVICGEGPAVLRIERGSVVEGLALGDLAKRRADSANPK